MNTLGKRQVAVCLCAAVLVSVLLAGCATGESGGEAVPAQGEMSSLVNGVTDQQEVVYCLYFGLADKDTGQQELTMSEAKEQVIPLFIEAGSGYTVYEAEGGFATEEGTIVRNDTLVFDSTHGSEQAIRDLVEKAKQTLNIESVYVESRTVGYKMYGGVISSVE